MTSPREKFQDLLRKLFQFDSAELDFGIYRIMKHKRAVIEKFIEKDLLDAVTAELAAGALAQQTTLADELAETIEQIKDKLGSEALNAEGNLDPNYEKTPLGKQYLKLYAAAAGAKNRPELEAEIFNHLYTFFSRYYDEGDFMSLRRYSKREKYAIPYNGEEVFLHWANSDQYYVKTGENFTDYSYTHGNWSVRFRLRNADVEQNNVKGAKRFFVPKLAKVTVDEVRREVTVPFEFRPLTSDEETRFGKTKLQEAIITEAAPVITELAKSTTDALAALAHEKRRDSDNNPVSLLNHHLRVYTKKNSADFFIHKDLKGFLERELDFYLKNEVLNLDELEASGEIRSENWFQILRVIKGIGRRIISFVAQIEDFQKRLFEKKKFVGSVEYCVTLDQLPTEFYAEIAANGKQREEWVRLYAIDEMKQDLANHGYSSPLTTNFLDENPYLVLDTKFFDADFKERLIASFDDLDERLDGICINSENLQALQLIERCYAGQLTSIYIDPPYNSDAGPISYKNGYRHSSWIALVENRLSISKRLLKDSGILCVTIDDYEAHNLRKLCERSLGDFGILGVVAIKNNPAGRTATVGFSICHEYAFFFGHPELAEVDRLEHSEAQKARYKEKDEIGFFEWTNFRKHGGVNTYRTTRPRQFYPIYVSGDKIRIPKLKWDNDRRQYDVLEKPKANEEVLLPIDSAGKERIWDFVVETARKNLKHFRVRKDSNGATAIYRKWRINEEGLLPQSWWDKSEYSAPEYGTNLLTKMFGAPHEFMFPKSVYAVADCLKVSGLRNDLSGCTLDYFAGSGTTGHAIINLNRQDDGNRKYLLVEVADYFESVLIRRLKKAIYSEEWKDGKPVTRKGTSHFMMYLNLESYEDSLDNIAFQASDERLLQMHDYVLTYMLDFETKVSPTFLNVEQLDSPFDYKLYRHGKDEPLHVDLPETFNYLIGLHVNTRKVYENKGARYLVYRGKSDERETAVIWRTTRGWGQKEFDADRTFIAKQKIVDGAEDIFVNTDSFIPGARSLDPVFKRRMFNEE